MSIVPVCIQPLLTFASDDGSIRTDFLISFRESWRRRIVVLGLCKLLGLTTASFRLAEALKVQPVGICALSAPAIPERAGGEVVRVI
jgi:hypothetical protein